MKLLPSIVSGCGLDLGSSKEPLEVVKWLMASAVELDYYARIKHKESEPVRGAAAGCVKPIGNVFLSWTIRSPRERTAMRGVKFALDYFNLSYFDYTKCRADESRDEAAAIAERLQAAIEAASCSIELMSSEFGSEWIDHERRLLRANTSLPRVVLCLDWGGAQFIRSEDEHRIVRIDISAGRPMVAPTGNQKWMLAASDDSYYRTDTYLSKALTLGRALRECHETGDFSPLRSRLVGPSPNVRELRAFMAWIER